MTIKSTEKRCRAAARYYERKHAAASIQRFWRETRRSSEARSHRPSRRTAAATTGSRGRVVGIAIGAVSFKGAPSKGKQSLRRKNVASKQSSARSRSWLSLRGRRRRYMREKKERNEHDNPAADAEYSSDSDTDSINPALSSTGTSISSVDSSSSSSTSSASLTPSHGDKQAPSSFSYVLKQTPPPPRFNTHACPRCGRPPRPFRGHGAQRYRGVDAIGAAQRCGHCFPKHSLRDRTPFLHQRHVSPFSVARAQDVQSMKPAAAVPYHRHATRCPFHFYFDVFSYTRCI